MGLSWNLSDPATRHDWESLVDREIRARDPLLDDEAGLSGTSYKSGVVIKDELSTHAGAYITMRFKYQTQARGRQGEEVLKGHEIGYQTATDNIYVNILRNAFQTDSPIVEQYVDDDTAEEGKENLADWAATRISFGLHAHAAGIGLITDSAFNLHNTISAMNSTYIIRPNGKTAGNLVSGDVFDVDLCNEISQFVKTIRPKIAPAQTPWGPRYCVFLHPDQVKSLRDSNSLWFAQMQAAMQGGAINDNPIFTTALGEQNGFVFFESDMVPPGLNSGETAFKANTRRAWVLGAGGLALAFGRGYKVAPGYSLNRWQWTKETEDYQHSHGMAITSILGAKRRRFTKPGEASAREAGIVVVETYADHGVLTAAEAFADWTFAAPTATVEA